MSNPSPVSSLHVILCKGESNSQEDEYLKILSNLTNLHGASTLHLLQFTWKNVSQLKNCLENPDKYSGLILTSVRAVNAIKNCIGQSETLNLWKNKYIFCVGPKTITETQLQLGLNHSLPDDCAIGNVSSLIESISKCNLNLTGDLLFPCSSIANVDGPKLLEKYKIKYEVIHVYDTLPISDAVNQFNSLVQSIPQSVELVIVFFSPSNLNAVLEPVTNLVKDAERQVKLVALGPTTEASLKEAGFEVKSTLSKPSPSYLLEVINSYL